MSFIETSFYFLKRQYGKIVDFYSYVSESLNLDSGRQKVVSTKSTITAVVIVERKPIQLGLDKSAVTYSDMLLILSIPTVTVKDWIIYNGQRYNIFDISESFPNVHICHASKAEGDGSRGAIEESVSTSIGVSASSLGDESGQTVLTNITLGGSANGTV
jgi:hypothetical protein